MCCHYLIFLFPFGLVPRIVELPRMSLCHLLSVELNEVSSKENKFRHEILSCSAVLAQAGHKSEVPDPTVATVLPKYCAPSMATFLFFLMSYGNFKVRNTNEVTSPRIA